MTKHKGRPALDTYMDFMGYASTPGRPTAAPSRTSGWSIDRPVSAANDADLRRGEANDDRTTQPTYRGVREENRPATKTMDKLAQGVREETCGHSSTHGDETPKGNLGSLDAVLHPSSTDETPKGDDRSRDFVLPKVVTFRTPVAESCNEVPMQEREVPTAGDASPDLVEFYSSGPLWRRPAEWVRAAYGRPTSS